MSIEKVLDVKSYAGNPHVGFDEGEIVSAATPRRGFLHCKLRKIITRTVALALCLITVMEAMAADIRWDAPSSVKVGQTFYVRAYYNSIKASVWVDASASSGSVWEWDAADQYKAATAGSVTFYFQYDVGSQRYTSKKVVTIQGDSQPEQPTLGSVSISLSSSSVAPGDAVSCSLNAYSTTGASITGGTKSWKVSSTTNDTISSSGVVTVAAAQISRKISVTGSYTYGGVTKSATATITVTRLPIALASIRLIAPSYRVTPGTQIPVSLEADSVYDGPITDGVASWRVIPTEFGDSVSTDGIVSISSTNVNRVVKIACDYSFDGITKSDTIEVQVRSRYDARANVIADYVDANNEEYQALNYIEATGSQWIVTDIRPTCTDTVNMKFRLSSISKTQTLYCSRTTKTSNTFTAFLLDSVVRCDRNTNTSTKGNTVPSVMEDTTLVADYYTRKFSVNGVEQNALMAEGGYTPGSALMLFASNTKGNALSMDIAPGDVDNKATYRLYFLELYSQGRQSPKHRLVPARRISDSVVGLYDTIWGEFYGPADNSDEFVPSPYTTDVKALQRYPWSGKVDIAYTVFGNFMENAQQNASVASLKVTATDRDANMTYIATQLSGDLSLAEGTHAIVWDMDAEGLSLKSTNVVFEVSCVMAPAIYCVIDLSMGANATSYPVTYLSTPPGGGFNVDEYKTTKLVLRRIEAGTFIMGDDQSDESHRVTLTKPFFCGLFEVTQKQYSLITGGNPSNFSGDKRPVEQVSYSTIRGTSDGANWPSSSAVDSSSFLGKLRARTGLDFDLPTEAQWEYACRAGTTTTYSFDDSEDGNYYMWAYFNSDSQSHDVGTKNPNPWGFFDMHGNVWELCLDWFGELSVGTDPKGSSSGSARVKRGGSWTSKVANSTSSARYQHGPSLEDDTVGFRLVRILPNDSENSAIVLCGGKSAVTEVSISTSGDYPTEVTIGDKTHVYCYDVDGGVGIVQTGIGAVDSSLDIPSAIDNKSLVAIGHYAFVDCGDIETVTIPASVAKIGDFAFAGCSNLLQVTISGDIGTLTIGGDAFDATTEVTIGDRQGYEFVGWTNAVGRIVADPFHSADTVTVSPWWRKIVNVGYDANGGYGEMATQTVIEGDSLSLSANAFARDGYSFMGWSLSVGGEVAYPDMAEFAKVSAKMDGVVLYAVWKPQPPVISLEGGAEFQNASRFVSLSCDTGDALILFTKDGGDPRASGHVYKDPIYIYGTCTLRAVACGAGHYSDEVSATLTRTEGLSEAANLYGYLMETDADSPWTIVTDVSRDGVSSVRSGTVGHGGMTWLQTSVRKAGTISFWWRAACEDAEDEEGETYWYDYGSFSVDGVEKARIAGNDTGWRKIEVDVPTSGKHVLRWEYSKDGAASYSPDCIWLDQVQWVPADGSGYTLTTPDPVPYSWLSAWGLGLDSDFETAARQTSGKHDANGRPIAVWEDYVAGTVPTDANDLFRAIISMQDDGPHISWTPNLNTNGEVRVYRVWGKADLNDSAWTYPANPTHRFFKVTVELP